MINFGIVYGLSRVRARRPAATSRRRRRRSSSSATSSRFPKVQEFIDPHDRRAPPTRATSPRCSAASAASRSCGPASARRGQLGERLAVNTVDPGHRRRHHQGRDGALLDRRCARPGCPHGWSYRSTTSCCSRRPTSEVEQASKIIARRDGARARARPAAGGRRRRRRQLARGQVARSPTA